MTTLAEALALLDVGWQVLPLHEPTDTGCTCPEGADCASPGKHPRINWPAGQHIDQAQVRRWWTRWPTANVGIITGAVSGLFVLDVDPAHGGMASLRELCRRYRWQPDTLEARSGSGGIHLYLRHPGGHIAPSAGKLLPGLDVRADRGLIVAPPSRHISGGTYTWASHTPGWPLDPTPAWMLRALQPPERRTTRPVIVTGDSNYALAALARAVRNLAAAAEGTVHDTLWREAYGIGRLVAAGLLDETTARQALLDALPSGIRSAKAAERTIAAKFAYASSRPCQVAQ